MDFPGNWIPPVSISSASKYCGEPGGYANGFSTTSATGALSANTTIYIPLNLPGPFPVRSFFWVNGTTVSASNVQMCIRNVGGGILVQSVATNQATASAMQIVLPTGGGTVLIPAGNYLLGIGAASGSSQFFSRTGALQLVARLGYNGSNTVLGAPNGTMLATSVVPLCGISRWDGTSTGHVY